MAKPWQSVCVPHNHPATASTLIGYTNIACQGRQTRLETAEPFPQAEVPPRQALRPSPFYLQVKIRSFSSALHETSHQLASM